MKWTDILILAVLQTIWGGMPTAVKVCLREMPVETLIFVRYGLTALFLLLITSFLKQHTRVDKKDVKWLLAVGVLVYIVSPLLALNGMRLSQAIDISVLVSLEPLTTAVLAYFILKEHLDQKKVISIALAILGVLLLSNIHQVSSASFSNLRLWGNLFFLLSLFCEASHTVLGRSLSTRYSPIAMSAYTFSIGFLGFAAFNWQQINYIAQHALQWSWQTWAGIFYLAGLCSAMGYTVWFVLLKRLTANTIALSLYLQAVVGALIGHFYLGEKFEGLAWLGVVLILVAVSMGLYTRQRGNEVRKRAAAVGFLRGLE